MTAKKISPKKLEALMARGATLGPKPMAEPKLVPTPRPEPATVQGLLKNVSPKKVNLDQISSSMERLVKIMSHNSNHHEESKPTRLNINRDEFGLIESIDILRGSDSSHKVN